MRAGSNGSSTTAGSGSAVYLAGGAASSAQQLVQVQTNGSTNGGQVRPVSGAVILLLEFFKFEINVHRYSQHSEKLSTSFSLKVSLTGGITYQLLGIGGLIVLNRF